MSDKAGPDGGRHLPPGWTWFAGGVVVALAISALLWPVRERPTSAEALLVLDPCLEERGRDVYAPIAAWLSAELGRPLRLVVATNLTRDATRSASLVICPDRLALALPSSGFAPLAVGRRQAPMNLRPRSVLVYRRAAGLPAAPWLTQPGRTICGDSLSLAGAGIVCRGDAGGIRAAVARGVRFGPDPYDHGVVLHALRLGCFDYALVRESAARRFFAVGLLNQDLFGLVPLSEPLPDIVVLATRRWPVVEQLRTRELLVGLGRQTGAVAAPQRDVLHALGTIRLDGFNLLLEPDFEQARHEFRGCWPALGN